MAKKVTILLPTPSAYIDYVNKVLLDAFELDVPTFSTVEPTTSVAKKIVNKEGYFLLEEERGE